MGVDVAVGGTPSLTGEFIGETHRVLEHTETHPLGKQQQKGPILLWVVEGVTENWQSKSKSRARDIAPYQTSPLHTALQRAATSITPPW